MAGQQYVQLNQRIPAELDKSMRAVVSKGDRYKSNAQFIVTALRRLITFEEKEMERREKGVDGAAGSGR